jgi:signal transduction histidine kinase
MPEEVQGRLFTPFFTTKENGTGLGLATARKIVEAHRGTIRVASEVGRGSTFVVAIPMARGEYNPAAGGTAATSSRG